LMWDREGRLRCDWYKAAKNWTIAEG